jgi:hypothetical protein
VHPQPKLVQQPLGEQLRPDRAVSVHHDVLTLALLERAYRTRDVAVDDAQRELLVLRALATIGDTSD